MLFVVETLYHVYTPYWLQRSESISDVEGDMDESSKGKVLSPKDPSLMSSGQEVVKNERMEEERHAEIVPEVTAEVMQEAEGVVSKVTECMEEAEIVPEVTAEVTQKAEGVVSKVTGCMEEERHAEVVPDITTEVSQEAEVIEEVMSKVSHARSQSHLSNTL